MLKIPYLLKLNPWFVGIVCFSCEQIAILQAVRPNNKQLILDAQLLVGVFHTLVHRLLLHRLHWPEREKHEEKKTKKLVWKWTMSLKYQIFIIRWRWKWFLMTQTLQNIKLRQILVKTYWRENICLFNKTCFEMIDGRRNSKLIGIILNWCDRFLIESLRFWNAMKRLKFTQSINLERKRLRRSLRSKNNRNRHFWGIWLLPCGLVCCLIGLSIHCTPYYFIESVFDRLYWNIKAKP